ncbi:MAG: dihydrodipicolinate synthase family protein, partial [Muribaculaceae bacterium]|nr:dihydrodipicolinate synthase family protein [Muribaculaceae bacterium]
MARINLTGMGVALITPFKADKSIDFEALARLIEYQISNQVDYIVVLGTTAETPALTVEEQAEVRAFVIDRVNGRVPLVIGIGGNCTADVIRRITSTDLSAFSAILSVVPYYNKPSQEGIYQHYHAIAEASPLPIILYNVPGRTGVNVPAETALRLAGAQHGTSIGIPDASGHLTQRADMSKRKT